jgi:hypothetical protein
MTGVEKKEMKVGRRDFEISHSTQRGEKNGHYGQPRTPWSNLLLRFFRKEFGSNWEEQYKEYEEFWKDYFFAHTLN